eukprot:9501735-Pyramimonas_sp.AAC.1
MHVRFAAHRRAAPAPPFAHFPLSMLEGQSSWAGQPTSLEEGCLPVCEGGVLKQAGFQGPL